MPACFAALLRCLCSSLSLSLFSISLSLSLAVCAFPVAIMLCRQTKQTHKQIFSRLCCQPSVAASTRFLSFSRSLALSPFLPLSKCVCVSEKSLTRPNCEIAVSKSWRQSQLAWGKSIRPKNLLANVVERKYLVKWQQDRE